MQPQQVEQLEPEGLGLFYLEKGVWCLLPPSCPMRRENPNELERLMRLRLHYICNNCQRAGCGAAGRELTEIETEQINMLKDIDGR